MLVELSRSYLRSCRSMCNLRLRMSLAQRMTLLTVGLLVGLTIALSALTLCSQQRAGEERLARRADATARMLARTAAAYIAEGRLEDIQPAVLEAAAIEDLIHLCIQDENGRILAAVGGDRGKAPGATLAHDPAAALPADE